jgi:hypothetical protein
MPEHLSRRVFLDVEEVEVLAQPPVVEFVHGRAPCVNGEGTGRSKGKWPRPFPARPFLGDCAAFYRERPGHDPPGLVVVVVGRWRAIFSMDRRYPGSRGSVKPVSR